jgi:hypothetical protein
MIYQTYKPKLILNLGHRTIPSALRAAFTTGDHRPHTADLSNGSALQAGRRISVLPVSCGEVARCRGVCIPRLPACAASASRCRGGVADRFQHASSQPSPVSGFWRVVVGQPILAAAAFPGGILGPSFQPVHAGLKAGGAVENHPTIGGVTWHTPSACAGQDKRPVLQNAGFHRDSCAACPLGQPERPPHNQRAESRILPAREETKLQ